jgi:hypothetical protein
LLQRIAKGAQIVSPGVAGAAAQGSDPWLERLRARLPEPLRGQLVAVLEKPGELVLFAESAVWAGRLRLALPALGGEAGGRKLTVRLRQGLRSRK